MFHIFVLSQVHPSDKQIHLPLFLLNRTENRDRAFGLSETQIAPPAPSPMYLSGPVRVQIQMLVSKGFPGLHP